MHLKLIIGLSLLICFAASQAPGAPGAPGPPGPPAPPAPPAPPGPAPPAPPGPPRIVCGDSKKDVSEECDDGNNDNTDGCKNDCKFPVCGDDVKSTGEECDDGNNVNDDGCQGDCKLPRGVAIDCGNCLIGHLDSGCNVPAIETCVCQNDSWCCDNAWDKYCVPIVQSGCQFECKKPECKWINKGFVTYFGDHKVIKAKVGYSLEKSQQLCLSDFAAQQCNAVEFRPNDPWAHDRVSIFFSYDPKSYSEKNYRATSKYYPSDQRTYYYECVVV